MGIGNNRDRNGDHYWVNAFITPIREGDQVVGFESVRVRATPEEIARTTAFYARLHSGRGMPINWRRQLLAIAPATLCSVIGVAGADRAGPLCLTPAALVAAPRRLRLRHHRYTRSIGLSRRSA